MNETVAARGSAENPGAWPSVFPELSAAALTVVVVCWDTYVAYLPACLSALADEPSVRVLVVDNQSRIPLGPLPVDVSYVRLPERLSRSGARNAALALVKSDMVCFLDADDELLPGTLAAMAARLRDDPRLVCAARHYGHWDADAGRVTRGPWPPTFAYRPRGPRAMALLCAWRNIVPVTAPAVLRTRAVRRAGGFSGDLHDDWALAAALCWVGRIELHPEIGLRYRVHHGSVSRQAYPAALGRRARREVRARAASVAPWWARCLISMLAFAHAYDVRLQYPREDV